MPGKSCMSALSQRPRVSTKTTQHCAEQRHGADAVNGAAHAGRYPAYVKHSEAAPEWYAYCTELTRNCPPSQCPSTASASLTPAFGGSSRWRSDMVKSAKNTICL